MSAAAIWNALRTTTDDVIRLNPTDTPKYLLVGLRFLWRYEREPDLAKYFGWTDAVTVRYWSKLFTRRIHRLLPDKVCTAVGLAALILLLASCSLLHVVVVFADGNFCRTRYRLRFHAYCRWDSLPHTRDSSMVFHLVQSQVQWARFEL